MLKENFAEKYSSATSDSTQVRRAEKLGSQVGRRIATSSGQTPCPLSLSTTSLSYKEINFRATPILFLSKNTVHCLYLYLWHRHPIDVRWFTLCINNGFPIISAWELHKNHGYGVDNLVRHQLPTISFQMCSQWRGDTISAVNIFLQTPPYLHLGPMYRRSQDWCLVLVSVFFDDCSELCCFCFTTEKRHLPSIEKCDLALIQFRSIILGSLDYRELQPIIRPLSTAQLCLFGL